MFPILGLSGIFIGLPLFANAECDSGYTQLSKVSVCGQKVGGSSPACASGYGSVSNGGDCRQNDSTVIINASNPSVIYSTKGDEGTGPTWLRRSTTNSSPNDKDYMKHEHHRDFSFSRALDFFGVGLVVNIGGAIWYRDSAANSTPDDDDYINDEQYSNFSFSPAFDVFGADLVVNFTGTEITWIGKVGPNFGIASYSVDGGEPVALDAYSPTLIRQNNNVVISGLPSGSHSLKIEVTHTKNAVSSDYYQVIDAFKINGSPLTLDQAAVAGYNSPELSFSGPWTCGPSANGSDLSGGHCYSNAKNASISWRFTGSLIEVYGRPDAEDGIFNVLIDGTRVGQVDGHFGPIDNDALNGYGLFQAKVAPGTHTIQLVNAGARDSAATSTYAQIDMFVAFP